MRTPEPAVDQHLVAFHAPASFEAEQYLVLRHALERLPKIGLVVAVSSAGAGEGKTTTAINLAVALARAPEGAILVVEADLRRPSVASRLGLGSDPAPGLVDGILDSGLTLKDLVRHMPGTNLAVLPAGRHHASPPELLRSPRLGELLEDARRQYECLVMDAPPLLPFPDCRLIARLVDGFLVVVAAHRTPRKLLEEALRIPDPAQILGLVFNRDDQSAPAYYYQAYGPRPASGREA